MNNNKRTPQIRFAGFTDDWEQRKLGDIGSLKNGMNMDKNALGYGYPFVNLQDIFEKSEVDVKNLGLVNSTEQQRQEYNLLKGDVLFVRSSVKIEGVGLTSLICNDISNATYSGFIIRFRSNIEINDTYKRIMFSIKPIRDQILSSATSSANTNINQEALKEIKLSIPKLEEQTTIGNFFKQLDETIALHQREYEKYKNLKNSYLEKMFPKENEQFPELRFPEFTDAWEQRKLGEITISFSGGTPNVSNNEYYNGKIPFIRSGEINSDKTELFISDLGLNNSSAKLVKKGDILYALYGATSGEVGRSKIYGAINQAILAIIPDEQNDSEFITQWLVQHKSLIIQTYLQGGQGNLSGEIVKNLVITKPKTIQEQTTIGNFFKQLDETIALHQRKAEKFKQIKQFYLEKMFV